MACTKVLLKCGVYIQSGMGFNCNAPLHEVASARAQQVCWVLLNANHPLNVVNAFGNTLLDAVVHAGSIVVGELLVELGADVKKVQNH